MLKMERKEKESDIGRDCEEGGEGERERAW